MNETSRQSRFDARYWMLGAGALGRPRGMVRGGRREEGSGWGTHVYLWRIHFDIWQNQYNIVKFKNKIKFKKKKRRRVGHNGACTHAILLSGIQSFPRAMSFLCIPRDLSTNYHYMPYTHSVS